MTNDEMIRRLRDPGLIYATAYGATCQLVNRMHIGDLTPDQAFTRITELRGVVDSHLAQLQAELEADAAAHLARRGNGRHSRLEDHFTPIYVADENGGDQNDAGDPVIEP